MKIGMIGTGVFSSSLAFLLAQDSSNEIIMWSESKKLVEKYEKTAKIESIFQDRMFPKNIFLTNSYEEAVKNVDLLFFVTGVSYLENVCQDIQSFLSITVPICIGTKGLAKGSQKFVHEIVSSIFKNPIVLLGGPTFASDVIKMDPVGFVLASKYKKSLKLVEKAFSSSSVKLNFSKDLLGTAICGSVKNVYAIGAGILNGLGFGDSTQALYLTRVYQELEIILFKMGSSLLTLHGLAGLGDLVLTCSSSESRNYSFGKLLATSLSKKEVDQYLNKNTVEGVSTLESLFHLFQKKHIETPLFSILYAIVFEDEAVEKLVQEIMKKSN